MRFVATLSSLLLAAGITSAQSRSSQPDQQRGPQGTPAAAPGPMPGLGGVPAAAPGPMPGLGGVPAAIPQTQPLGQPLSQPQYKPMQVRPWSDLQSAPATPASTTNPGATRPPGFNSPLVVRPGNAGGSTSGTNISLNNSGLTANGFYNGDHWRIVFNLGSGGFFGPIHSPHGMWHQVGWGNPSWWYDDYRSYFGNRYGNLYGFYSPPDPNLSYTPPAPTPPMTEAVTPSTNRELGDTYLRAGDSRAAIKAYQAHLKQYPGDEETMRALGLALLDEGRTTEAVAMIAMAYKAEPLLADRVIPQDTFREGRTGMARNVAKASIYANRVKSDSGWLAVAVLMQAQGRNDLARSMVERAKAAGLEPGVADRMFSALR